jgi:hypothetical protein
LGSLISIHIHGRADCSDSTSFGVRFSLPRDVFGTVFAFVLRFDVLAILALFSAQSSSCPLHHFGFFEGYLHRIIATTTEIATIARSQEL